ncbi:MAG: phosphoribosylaminoimidazolesuccinocarboxamide synthase [Euryarchaeota archaeon]|nr:phosphoribosylaminoimidazolesuccinocarboxamide synthase [Euryarchaeota archaeon]
MELLRKGKVKEVYGVSQTELEFHFTDQISVFDKVIPTLIPRKGETLARTSAFWFKRVERIGIKTHFLSQNAPDKMRVRRVQVIADYAKLDHKTTNYLIPLEVICRHYVAGSLHDRLKAGEVKPETLGFSKAHAPKYAEKLPRPMLEFTTKLEKVDRLLSEDEAKRISGLNETELENVKRTVLRIDEEIARGASERGLVHVDGKKEFAFDQDRELMLIDTFGTADEDRWWDKKRFEAGETVELSKEHVRQYYRKVGYYEKLQEAREARTPEPDIPALPGAVTAEVSALYMNLYERITGEKF